LTELQQSRYDAVLRRVGDLKGPGSKVNDVLTELFPMFDVENLQPELFLLGGQVLGMGSSELSAGAGLTPNIGIFNPLNSGKLITVTLVTASMTSSTVLLWSTAHTAFTTLVTTNLSRDTRILAPELPVGQIREETAAGLLTANGRVRIQASTPFILTDPNGLAVLAPGGGFAIGGGSFQSTLNASFFWRERVAEPSELNL